MTPHTPPFLSNSGQAWILASLVAALSIVIISSAYGISRAMTHDLERVQASIARPLWSPHQVAVAHGRLLRAVESGADIVTLEREATAFLQLVNHLYLAPQFYDAAKVGRHQIDGFEQLVSHTGKLLAEAALPGGRDALRKQLQRDAEFVDVFTVALSDVNRSHLQQERTERAASLRSNLNMLPYLHVAILGLVLLVMLIVWRLIFAARERERQDATQASILKVVDDGMIGVCEGGNVVFFNAASEAMLDHAIMRGCPLPRPAQKGGGLLGHVRSLLKEGERLDPETFTARRAVQLGEGMKRRHYSLRLSRSRERLGSPSAGYAYVITMRDVTVEVEAAQQSAQYEAGLARVSRVMSYAVISGGLVHEISQPLAALQNYLHVLRSSPECAAMPEPRREILGHLGVEADRISEIIRNVRAMGPQEVKLDGSCCLSEAVARSVRLLSLGATPPPAISIKTAAGADLRVRGSLPLIGQVIINLIRNALQASAASGDSGAVVFLRRFDGFAEIAIADFGKGVSPEAAASMFEPFCQSERGGMGLGLAICQRIAANLGGSIGWKNREAGGTVFTFKVPLAGKELTA